MAIKSPSGFIETYDGKSIDYDGAYGVQCVDGFKVGCAYMGVPVVACPNNWAESYWSCQNPDGSINQSVLKWQTENFDLIDDPSKFRDGDWVVWMRGSASHPQSHIAMYYQGQEFGERQYEDIRGFCLKYTDFSDAAGALRWKGWAMIPEYESDITINGHDYHLYGQSSRLRTVVLSPGLNQVQNIADNDCDYWVYAKITGCNYFQMRDDVEGQPYGMTFGDISAPLCDVYQSLANQDSTLYADIETGKFGDSTGVYIDSTHNVYSPAVVFRPNGRYEYARMVGIDHVNKVSRYTFAIRLNNGMYIFGLAADELTPKQIFADFRDLPEFESMAFLDGGGSANMMRYITKENRVEYTRNTGRETAGCLAMIGEKIPAEHTEPVIIPEIPETPETPPQATEPAPEEPETGKDEEIPMEQEKPQETPVITPLPDWTDPETGKKTVYDRIVALMAVKSIFSVTCLALFAFLVVNGKISENQFMTVFATVMAFYFGTTYQKNGNE